MKPNHNPGAKWRGNFDERIYVIARHGGKSGYTRDSVFFERTESDLRETLSTSNYFTYIGGGKPLTAKKIIAELEAQLAEASRRIERLNSESKVSNEYYARQQTDQERAMREVRDRADRAEKAHRIVSQTVQTMKRQIELMGEALKVSQGMAIA